MRNQDYIEDRYLAYLDFKAIDYNTFCASFDAGFSAAEKAILYPRNSISPPTNNPNDSGEIPEVMP